ncbi:MAG: hypothetical protein Q9164_004129, partial [Protoblastenia rupestris]
MSLASSVNHYKLENNRRYHTYRDGSYWVPHDKEAVELDTIAHHIFLLTLNDKLFLAPLQNPKKVLDVGTGNGIWAQDFADKFPDADIIGTLDHSLSPGGYLEQAEICPDLESDDNSIPKGCAFEQGGRLAIECGERSGKALDVQRHIKSWITNAGFIDVVEEKYKWPIGDWPADSRLKDIGKWNANHWNLGIEAWSMRLLTQYHD